MQRFEARLFQQVGGLASQQQTAAADHSGHEMSQVFSPSFSLSQDLMQFHSSMILSDDDDNAIDATVTDNEEHCNSNANRRGGGGGDHPSSFDLAVLLDSVNLFYDLDQYFSPSLGNSDNISHTGDNSQNANNSSVNNNNNNNNSVNNVNNNNNNNNNNAGSDHQNTLMSTTTTIQDKNKELERDISHDTITDLEYSDFASELDASSRAPENRSCDSLERQPATLEESICLS